MCIYAVRSSEICPPGCFLDVQPTAFARHWRPIGLLIDDVRPDVSRIYWLGRDGACFQEIAASACSTGCDNILCEVGGSTRRASKACCPRVACLPRGKVWSEREACHRRSSSCTLLQLPISGSRSQLTTQRATQYHSTNNRYLTTWSLFSASCSNKRPLAEGPRVAAESLTSRAGARHPYWLAVTGATLPKRAHQK